MSSDALLATSLVLVSIALLGAVLISIYDWKSPENVRKNAALRHGAKSPLSAGALGKFTIFLLYAATAYSSDVAFEWLASIALVSFFLFVAADRAMTLVMTKRNITPQDPAPKAEARQKALDEGEAAPEPLGEMLINIGGIVITLGAWAALFSLGMLLVFTFTEIVLPHYIEALGVLL